MQIRRHRRRRAHRGDWAPWRHLNGSALKNSSNLFLVSRAAAGVRGTELGEGVWRRTDSGDAAAQGRAPRQRLFRGAAGQPATAHKRISVSHICLGGHPRTARRTKDTFYLWPHATTARITAKGGVRRSPD